MRSHILFLLFTILSLLSVYSCNYGKRYSEITKIEIATGSCFGPCQPTITSIDSSLKYYFFGDNIPFELKSNTVKGIKLVGHYSGKVSKEFWDTLNIKMESINYKNLDTSYNHSIDDQSLEVFIHYGDKIKHIRAQSGSLPDNVANVFYYVIYSYKTIKLKPIKDTIRFESEAQRPVHMLNVKKIKFPPNGK